MSDLISRQDAIDKIDKAMTKEVAIAAVKALPSADRSEPGRWEIEQETDEYGFKRPKLVCSKCKKEPAAWDLTELFDFCPNCGADMRESAGPL